jgi:hypothetical protein
MAETEIERDTSLLSRERGKAATLIEGAVDRSDLYKSVESAIDAISSRHLSSILASLRAIRRQEVGEEFACTEEKAGNITDEEYASLVREKREHRELARKRELEIQKQKDAEEAKRQRELKLKQEEEARRRHKEREEARRAEREKLRQEQRRLDDQREKHHEERYARKRGGDRELRRGISRPGEEDDKHEYAKPWKINIVRLSPPRNARRLN